MNPRSAAIHGLKAVALAAALCTPLAQAQTADVSRVAWLAGCWKSAGGEAGSEEQWMPAAGGSMLGMGRTVKQGKAVAHEFMQIRAGADGVLAFHAMPSGKPPDTFPVLRMGEREVVFENLQHEFPQRVMYSMENDTRLAARIEGMRNGQLRGVDFPMDRVSCDARLAK